MFDLTIEQVQQLNPLVDSDGDSWRVRNVLYAISALIEASQFESMDQEQPMAGVREMLRACSSALEYMDKEINQK